MANLHSFYVSRPWQDLSYRLKVERGGRCERCGWTAATKDEWAKLIAHHRTELNADNVNVPAIALNPDNVEILCFACHNEEHRRFGHRKQVYIVYGSPLSGKSTAVKEMMRAGDIVLDIDRLWEAVTMCPPYIKPEAVKYNVFQLRDNLMTQIKRRYGGFGDAYIIGGYPNRYERERVAADMGAELIFCDTSKEECLRRRKASGRPKAWDAYIEDWWREYERAGS